MHADAPPAEPSDFDRLIRFLTTGPRRFALAIATSNHSAEQAQKLEQAVVAAQAAGRSIVRLAVQPAGSLLAQMLAAVGTADVLFVTGLDQLLLDPLGGAQPSPLIEQLNWDRDRLERELPVRVVFWLSESAARAFALAARDLHDVVMTRVSFARPLEVTRGYIERSGYLERSLPATTSSWRERALLRAVIRGRLADAGSAGMKRRLADYLFLRSQLEEGLRLLRQEVLPVYERLGDEREKAATLGRIAEVLVTRGEPDAGLRILREDVLPVYERLGDEREKAATLGRIAEVLVVRGGLDEGLRILREEVLPVYERLGDEITKAEMTGDIAEVLVVRGELDEGLRILRGEVLPVYERLGDERKKAVTLGKIADILAARGDLEAALRVRREVLPIYRRLGDERLQAVTMGRIADILVARGELEEALRIRREVLLVYEQIGDERLRAVTMGRIADILMARGELEEALRIRREEVLPVYERLGEVRNKAVAMGRIADILAAQGDLTEALRIRREEVLPVFEQNGGHDLVKGLTDTAALLIRRGGEADLIEARRYLERAVVRADAMKVPFPVELRRWLASNAGKSTQ